MAKKIEKLTPEQEARFEEFVNKWSAIGVDTTPINQPIAESIIEKIYKKQ